MFADYSWMVKVREPEKNSRTINLFCGLEETELVL
jgi:hypothetical protein